MILKVTEQEAAKLIRHFCFNGRAVDFDFGPGWMGLKHIEGEPVSDAILYLGLLRGVTNENCDGAGI